jgi:hypothetical protein
MLWVHELEQTKDIEVNLDQYSMMAHMMVAMLDRRKLLGWMILLAQKTG